MHKKKWRLDDPNSNILWLKGNKKKKANNQKLNLEDWLSSLGYKRKLQEDTEFM